MYLMILVLHVKTGSPPPFPPPQTHTDTHKSYQRQWEEGVFWKSRALYTLKRKHPDQLALPFPFTLRPGFPP